MFRAPWFYWTLGLIFLFLIMSVVIGEWEEAGGTYLISVGVAVIVMLWVRARAGKFHFPWGPVRILWTFVVAWVWPLFFPRHVLQRKPGQTGGHH